VFKEVLFALAVLLALSLMILRRYAQVLRRTLDIQLAAMEEISRGNLDRQVPVLSCDEFATVALKTNEMLQGLKERDFCRSSFSKYVSPEISRMVLNGDISPEGSTYDATILFCDLRDYTAFVENRDPKSVVAFMNHYFSIMQGIIARHGGMVLQYIGDEIEAVFGAPVRTADHPDCAVRAAEEMRTALDLLNTERRGRGRPAVHHGIGIHTGTVLAGNVGSADRLVYAMVGDTVNVASRLQVLNKTLGTGILLSRQTRDRLESAPRALRSMGTFPLKGKREEVEVFTIDGEADASP
jgi:adenylate cyclase